MPAGTGTDPTETYPKETDPIETALTRTYLTGTDAAAESGHTVTETSPGSDMRDHTGTGAVGRMNGTGTRSLGTGTRLGAEKAESIGIGQTVTDTL